MPEVGSASLAIIPSFKGFQSNLENGSSKALTAAGVSGGEQFGDAAAKSGGARFKAGMAKAAKVAAAGLAIGIAGAIKFGGDALEEAREAQKVGALTESTIKATGKAAKVTAKQVADLSGAISEKSGIDDEVIQRGANMLLTFKNIRNEAGKGNKIFNRTTKATADMAAAMAGGKGGDIDLKSASILLGKALNDPVKGLSALNRVGVQFSDQQKAINKALVEGGTLNAMAAFGTKVTAAEFAKIQKDNNATTQETIDIIMGPMSRAQEKLFKHYEEGGHALEAQRNILKEVNSQFGGAAAAQATEADKLKVAWSNLKEEVGTELIPVMDAASRFIRKKGIPAVKDFAGWVRDDMIPEVKHLADELDPVIEGVKDVVKWVDKLPAPAKWAGLAAILGGVGYSKLRGGNSMGGGGLLGTVGKTVGLAKPVPVFVTNPGFGPGGGPGGRPGIPPVVPGELPKKGLPKLAGKVRALAPILPAAGALGNDQLPPLMTDKDVRTWERANSEAVKFNDATKKLPNQLDQGNTAGENLLDTLLKVDRSDPKVQYTAPGFDTLLARTREYDSLLDGLNNRIVTTVMRTRYVKNDTGEGGGTVPQPPGRSGGVDVYIDKVEAHDYQDFMTQIGNRAQRNSLDGRRP